MQALKNIARDNDPAKLNLEDGFNKYVRLLYFALDVGGQVSFIDLGAVFARS
ncbi:MAG: hypothetical protein WCI51_03400 [Lentisphaerota bacterium]